MAGKRQVIAIPGAPYGPTGVKIGKFFFSSTINGAEPETGRFALEGETHFDDAFRNMKALVERANLTPEQVGMVTVFVPQAGYRKFINKPWLEAFPDDHDRPARKTTTFALPKGQLLQLQFVGVAGQRQPLEIPGLGHKDPLPVGVKIGDMVYSSVIGGHDPETGKQLEGVEAQIEQAFENMRILVEKAGGTTADLAHVWVFLRDRADQPAMVKSWLEMFPNDGDRPARKTVMYDELKGRETLIQLQFAAVLNGTRENLEIPGVGHHDPIPMGAKVGNMLFSSGIGGYDSKNGERVSGLDAQIGHAFENVRALMEQAGGTLDDIAHLGVLVRDQNAMPAVAKKWKEVFPNPNDEPARQVMTFGLAGDNLVQLHVTAVL